MKNTLNNDNGESSNNNSSEEIFLVSSQHETAEQSLTIVHLKVQNYEKVVHALDEYGLPPEAIYFIERDKIAIVGHVANSFKEDAKFEQPYDIFKPLKLYTTLLSKEFKALLEKAGYEHQKLRGTAACLGCANTMNMHAAYKREYLRSLPESAYGHAHPPDKKCSTPMKWISICPIKTANRPQDSSDGLPELPCSSIVRMFKSFDKTKNSYRYIEIVMLDNQQDLQSVIRERAPTTTLMTYFYCSELIYVQGPLLVGETHTFNKGSATTHCIGLQRMLEMRHIWHTHERLKYHYYGDDYAYKRMGTCQWLSPVDSRPNYDHYNIRADQQAALPRGVHY